MNILLSKLGGLRFRDCFHIAFRWLDGKSFYELRHVKAIRITLQHSEARKANMISVKLSRLLEADERRVNDVSALRSTIATICCALSSSEL